jgi:hypothetical protein
LDAALKAYPTPIARKLGFMMFAQWPALPIQPLTTAAGDE